MQEARSEVPKHQTDLEYFTWWRSALQGVQGPEAPVRRASQFLRGRSIRTTGRRGRLKRHACHATTLTQPNTVLAQNSSVGVFIIADQVKAWETNLLSPMPAPNQPVPMGTQVSLPLNLITVPRPG